MNYKPLKYFLSALLIFSFLVYYNYAKAQMAIKQTQPSPLSIDFVSIPESVKVGNSGTFIWRITSSSDLSTDYTTIYWGYTSTPSGLPKTASPLAVGYPYSSPDYATGTFGLPGTFDLNIPFTKPNRVFFRAYANIRGDHLWSDEKFVDIIK